MKKSLPLILILAALLGVSYYQSSSRGKRLSAGAASRELLLPELKAKSQNIKKVRLKEGSKELNLSQKGNQWVVAERSDYPAAAEKLGKAVQELIDQKAGKPQIVGESAWGDAKLLAPGKGEEAKTGLLVEMLDEKGSLLQSVILGSNVETSKAGGNASPFGGGSSERYARLDTDGNTSWVVPNQFYDLKPEPADWILKDFITIDKIKSVEVTATTPADSWKAFRGSETATDYVLEGSKDTVDSSKATITGYMASASFNDVLPKDKMTADLMKDSWNITITTFDGFTYGLRIAKKGEGSDEKHYLTLSVKGDFPKERPAVKDEKPEDKKKADEEFTAKLKTLNDKLAKEKLTEGWVYDVSSYTVNTLMKKRSEIVKVATSGELKPDGSSEVKIKPEAPAAPASAAPPVAPTPAAPATPPAKPAEPAAKAGPISVTTPPVSVPAEPAKQPEGEKK
jgi:hypothetical protein